MRWLAPLFALGAFAARADTASVAVRGGSAYMSGQLNRDRWAATAGIEALWRHGPWLVGGAVDASSRVGSVTTGDVRHLFFAVEGGTSLGLSRRLRLDLLGELGGHRLSGARSGPFRVPAASSPDGEVDVWLASNPAWAPFAGVRPSLELLFEELAVGLGFWARADLKPLNPEPFVDPAVPAQAQISSLGRFSAGADLHLALQF